MKSIILILSLFTISQSIGIEFNINVDVAELLKWAGTTFNSKEVYTERQDTADERFISYLGDGKITACYFHKTKRHTATCNGGTLGGGQIRAEASAGNWAIALCKAGVSGRKTYWNTLS